LYSFDGSVTMANLLYALEKNVFDGSVTMAEMAIKSLHYYIVEKTKTSGKSKLTI
jgi:hypothetical protein